VALPLQQIVYRQLMYLVLVHSMVTAGDRRPAALAQTEPHREAARDAQVST
jgi:hypothetical protein